MTHKLRVRRVWPVQRAASGRVRGRVGGRPADGQDGAVTCAAVTDPEARTVGTAGSGWSPTAGTWRQPERRLEPPRVC